MTGSGSRPPLAGKISCGRLMVLKAYAYMDYALHKAAVAAVFLLFSAATNGQSLAPVTNLTAVAVDNYIKLSWIEPSNSRAYVSYYLVAASIDGSRWQTIGQETAPSTGYIFWRSSASSSYNLSVTSLGAMSTYSDPAFVSVEPAQTDAASSPGLIAGVTVSIAVLCGLLAFAFTRLVQMLCRKTCLRTRSQRVTSEPAQKIGYFGQQASTRPENDRLDGFCNGTRSSSAGNPVFLTPLSATAGYSRYISTQSADEDDCLGTQASKYGRSGSSRSYYSHKNLLSSESQLHYTASTQSSFWASLNGAHDYGNKGSREVDPLANSDIVHGCELAHSAGPREESSSETSEGRAQNGNRDRVSSVNACSTGTGRLAAHKPRIRNIGTAIGCKKRSQLAETRLRMSFSNRLDYSDVSAASNAPLLINSSHGIPDQSEARTSLLGKVSLDDSFIPLHLFPARSTDATARFKQTAWQHGHTECLDEQIKLSDTTSSSSAPCESSLSLLLRQGPQPLMPTSYQATSGRGFQRGQPPQRQINVWYNCRSPQPGRNSHERPTGEEQQLREKLGTASHASPLAFSSPTVEHSTLVASSRHVGIDSLSRSRSPDVTRQQSAGKYTREQLGRAVETIRTKAPPAQQSLGRAVETIKAPPAQQSLAAMHRGDTRADFDFDAISEKIVASNAHCSSVFGHRSASDPRSCQSDTPAHGRTISAGEDLNWYDLHSLSCNATAAAADICCRQLPADVAASIRMDDPSFASPIVCYDHGIEGALADSWSQPWPRITPRASGRPSPGFVYPTGVLDVSEPVNGHAGAYDHVLPTVVHDAGRVERLLKELHHYQGSSEMNAKSRRGLETNM